LEDCELINTFSPWLKGPGGFLGGKEVARGRHYGMVGLENVKILMSWGKTTPNSE